MTKVTTQIRTEPDGNPAVGIETRVFQVDNGVRLRTMTSDSNGVVEYEENGSYGPISLRISGQPGGDRSLASGEAMTSGIFSPAELPAAFAVLGDGVIRGYLGELAVSAAGSQVTVETGGAVVAGYPVMFTQPTYRGIAAPTTSTRVDRVVVYVEPPTGFANIELRSGEEGSGEPPTLVQTADRYEIGLATISIGVVTPVETPVNERIFAGDRLDVVGSERVSSASTTSAPGEAITDMAVTLTLPRSVTYDIEADLSGQQVSVAASSAWTLQATYGPTVNSIAMSNPGQVASDSAGRVLIADTGNSRLVILTSGGVYSAGITGLTGITGVCVDSSSHIYVMYVGTITKYNGSTLALMWAVAGPTTPGHLATNSTNLYSTFPANHVVGNRLCATGAVSGAGGWGGGGTPNVPWGIAYNSITSKVVVVDSGNNQLVRYSTTGVLQSVVSLWAGMRGVAVDSAGVEWIARHADDQVYATSGASFAQADPSGIALATSDVIWVSNADDGTITKWDEAATPGGYGQIALEIDGTVSAYTGIGQRVGAVANSATGTKAGPGSVVVRGFQKSTLNTATFSGLTLSARAVPRG